MRTRRPLLGSTLPCIYAFSVERRLFKSTRHLRNVETKLRPLQVNVLDGLLHYIVILLRIFRQVMPLPFPLACLSPISIRLRRNNERNVLWLWICLIDGTAC